MPMRSDSLTGQFSKQRLERERNDWWDTRTTGSAEIWAALRSMVHSLQGGNVTEAQVLLDATECTCPNGMLWRGVFDNRGEWYKVPEWVVIEPEGLVEEDELKDEAGSVGEDDDKEVETEELGDDVKVKFRLSNTGKDHIVDLRRGERVASLVTKLKAQAGVSPRFHSAVLIRVLTPAIMSDRLRLTLKQLHSHVHIRFVYGGRPFEENQPLDANPHWNYDAKHIINAMVFE